VIRIDFAEGEACPLRDLPDSAGEQVQLVNGEAGGLADLVGNGEIRVSRRPQEGRRLTVGDAGSALPAERLISNAALACWSAGSASAP
jgi:hypothetical protein